MSDALQAVLFDMDGTLVDTEPAWIAAEYALVAKHGGQWSDEHAHALVGNALPDSAAYIRAHGGVALPDVELIDQLQRRVIREVHHGAPWRPGARELLAALQRAEIPCALVTMSYTPLVRAVLDQLPPDTFATVVSGDQVARGKPDPEPYLTAIARLGVSAQRCVAIEDSITGVSAARAAGCVVLAVPHHVPIPRIPGVVRGRSLAEVSVAELRALVAGDDHADFVQVSE